MTSEQIAYCKGCEYLRTASGEKTCDYSLLENRLRGNPVGPGCPHHTKIKPRAPHIPKCILPKGPGGRVSGRDGIKAGADRPPVKLDPERARALFMDGLSDQEMAAALGTNPRHVADWRRSVGLTRPKGRNKYKSEEKNMARSKKRETVEAVIEQEEIKTAAETTGEKPQMANEPARQDWSAQAISEAFFCLGVIEGIAEDHALTDSARELLHKTTGRLERLLNQAIARCGNHE